MRRAARKDGNHGEIEAVFRQMLGDHVTDTSGYGGGAGDLFVSFGSDPAYSCWVEIKRDGKAEFTAAQIRFQKDHPGCVFRVSNVDEAVKLCAFVRRMATVLGTGWNG